VNQLVFQTVCPGIDINIEAVNITFASNSKVTLVYDYSVVRK